MTRSFYIKNCMKAEEPEKAVQEESGKARVMTLPEVMEINLDTMWCMNHGCAWIEVGYGRKIAPVFPKYIYQEKLWVVSLYLHNEMEQFDTETWWNLEMYGKSWRMWTQRPTEKQMSDVPWEEY